MLNFEIHTVESAPEASREALRGAEEAYGFVPNLMGTMARVPSLLNAYWAVSKQLAATSLSPVEQQVVALAVSRHNECEYCMAAHSAVASLAGLPGEELDALRAGHRLGDPKLEALRAFTVAMVEERGHVSDAGIQDFLDAGFSVEQLLEVIVGIAMKTLSNFTNHVVHTPVDGAFQSFRWEAERSGEPRPAAVG